MSRPGPGRGRHCNLDRNDWSARPGWAAQWAISWLETRVRSSGLRPGHDWVPNIAWPGVGRAAHSRDIHNFHFDQTTIIPSLSILQMSAGCAQMSWGEHGWIFTVTALLWSQQVMCTYPPVRRAGPSGRAGLTIVYVLVGTHLSSGTFHRFSLMPTELGEYECAVCASFAGYRVL